VDGDGFDDILVGAYVGDSGGAYLVLGSEQPIDSLLGNDNTLFNGEMPWDYAGFSVSSAGDTNADGFGDILIGAFGNDEAGEDAGAAYLLFGMGE
jgi:hypothetical protein